MGSLYSGWNSERFETAENQFHPTSMIFFGPLSTLENFGTPILTIVIICFNDLYSHIIPTNNPHMDRYILIILGEISHYVAIDTAKIIHSLDPHNQRWQPQISPFRWLDDSMIL